MMLVNVLTDFIIIQKKNVSQTATGETVVWTPVDTRYALVIPLDAKARAVYQQLKSEVSHKVILRGSVSLSLGNNRLLWNDKILEPVEPAQKIDNATIVICKEV